MSTLMRPAVVTAEDKDALLREFCKMIELFVFYDPDSYDLVLQRMPEHWDDIAKKTTCRHPFCPSRDHVSQPGTLRVSIEKSEKSVDSNDGLDFDLEIPLEPLYPWSKSLKNGPWSRDRRGIGKEVVAWWCLSCMEAIWLEEGGFIKEPWIAQPRVGPQLWELFCLNVLLPETREAGLKNKLYHLTSPEVYCFQKWMAVYKHKANRDGGTYYGPDVVYGGELNALYENEELMNLDSVDEITGRSIVVRAIDVEDLRLSEALRWVNQKVERGRQLWATENRPQSLILKLPITYNGPPPAKRRKLTLRPPKKGDEGIAVDEEGTAEKPAEEKEGTARGESIVEEEESRPQGEEGSTEPEVLRLPDDEVSDRGRVSPAADEVDDEEL